MFQISEFSKIARVSPRQLRHYEALGLFAPERIDPMTGYRYYSARQLPRLNRIIVLKELGLSLDQVARFLEKDISPEEIHGMLTMKKAQLEQTVRDELSRILSIEDRLKQIEENGAFPDRDVVLRPVQAQQFLSTRQVVASIRDGFSLMYELHRLLPERIGKGVLGNFLLIMHSDNFDTENVDVEMGFLLERESSHTVALPDGQVMTVRALPAVETAATLVCVGVAHHVSCYGTLGSWIENNSYQLAGPTREIFMEPLQPGKEDEAVIELQIPVRRIGNTYDLDQLLLKS
jgi:DNA-binding transcriptional MerR regulator/effector-binding domain-containing protein